MKKLAILLVMLMLIAIPANAQISWNTVDEDNNLISISGPAQKGQLVTIIIINDGYDIDDYTSEDPDTRHNAIKYYGYTIAGDNGYELSGIEIADVGKYDVYAAGEELIDFAYYPSTAKKAAIDALNKDANNANAEYLIKVFELESDKLVTGNGNYHSRIKDLKGKLDRNDLEGSKEKIKNSLILAAFDSGKEDLLINGDELVYAAELGFTDADGKNIPQYDDYLKSILNSTGIKNIKNDILSADYDSLDEVKAVFCESFYINAIMNNKLSGYGHIQELLLNENYKDDYQKAFKDADEKFPPAENKTVYNDLLKSDAYTLEEIAEALNKEPESTGSGNSGNGSGTGSLRPSQNFNSGTTTPSTPVIPDNNKPEDTSISFTDTAEHWAKDAIAALAKSGVVNGYEDNSFKPDNTVTRAEFAKMIATVLKLDIADTASSFSDVTAADWFAPYVAAAAKGGIITGADGRFNPNDIITRQDAAVILARAAKLEAAGDASFTDNENIADYAMDAAAAVQEAGIMQGMEDGSFAPYGSLTRGQAATVLYRLMQKGV